MDRRAPLFRSPFLEGNVFVGNFRSSRGVTAAGTVRFLGRPRLTVKIVYPSACRACAGSRGDSAAAAPEHGKVRSHNFEAGALLAFFVLPFAGLNPALDKNQRALFQVLL